MTVVVPFPHNAASLRDSMRRLGVYEEEQRAESASIIILPIVRIERCPDAPADDTPRSRRRRRRGRS